MRRWRSLPRLGGVKSIAYMWYVYILKSTKDGSYYIGCTNNHARRLEEHNSGYNLSTKSKAPWETVHIEEYDSQLIAFEREKKIKSYKGGNAFKKLLH
ncbi:hypothetical protein BH11PAT3_BH11PAT3_2550 [soil metagenome]